MAVNESLNDSDLRLAAIDVDALVQPLEKVDEETSISSNMLFSPRVQPSYTFHSFDPLISLKKGIFFDVSFRQFLLV